MMDRHDQLIAYLATLLALVVVWGGALWAAKGGLTGLEGLGLGTITGGLIGVLSRPSARTPGGMTESGDVNVRS